MPVVKITINKRGEINMDYEGFHGNECHLAEQSIKERIKNLKMTTVGSTDKHQEDRMLELEND